MKGYGRESALRPTGSPSPYPSRRRIVGLCVPLPTSAPDEAVHHLAGCFLQDTVISSLTIPDELLFQIFMPVGLNARTLFSGYSYEDFAKVVVFGIEGQHQQVGRVRGWPMFGECQIWLLADFERARQIAVRTIDEVDQALLRPAAPRRQRRRAVGP